MTSHLHIHAIRVRALVLLTLYAFTLSLAHAATVQVALDPATRYQTVLGWGAATPYLSLTPELRDDLIREAVDELGLTRLRLEAPGGNSTVNHSYEWSNDDGDPEHLNWSAFNTAQLDKKVTEWVLPFKQRIEAGGAPFSIYLSPSFFNSGSTGAAPGFLRYSPGEYAEYAMAFLLRLKQLGIEPDLYCICNEAGNNNPFTAALVANCIRALGPRMAAAGLATKIQFPECVNGSMSWSYLQATQNDPDIWPYIGVVSYHLYGDNSQRSHTRQRRQSYHNGLDSHFELVVNQHNHRIWRKKRSLLCEALFSRSVDYVRQRFG
jgi:O-glycosyl hydrolase